MERHRQIPIFPANPNKDLVVSKEKLLDKVTCSAMCKYQLVQQLLETPGGAGKLSLQPAILKVTSSKTTPSTENSGTRAKTPVPRKSIK